MRDIFYIILSDSQSREGFAQWLLWQTNAAALHYGVGEL
jgi:hypothetical protein